MKRATPVKIAPGQSRPTAFDIAVSDASSIELVSQVSYTIKHLEKVEKTALVKHVFHPRQPREPQKITYLHPGGIVSYAILRPPSEKAVIHTEASASLPVILALHGAGVETDSDMIRHSFDGAPDLRGWLLYPSGVTPWSGDDWHRWGFADVEAAIAAIPSWIETTQWQGPGVDIDRWLVTGHSNGGRSPGSHVLSMSSDKASGQGVWYALTHRPDKVIGAAPVSGYSSIQGLFFPAFLSLPVTAFPALTTLAYVPYQFWHEVDPAITALLQTSLVDYRHELLLQNVCDIPIHIQHGSLDDNVPPSHSRKMSMLLSQLQCPYEYIELPGKGHWFEGVMTTPSLVAFYNHVLERDIPECSASRPFTVVIANPSTLASRRGIFVDQLTSPDICGRITGILDPEADIWHLQTLNIHRLHFSAIHGGWIRSHFTIDGSSLKLAEHVPIAHQWLVHLADGSWEIYSDDKFISIERYGLQFGGLNAMLDTRGPFVISSSNLSISLTVQVSRNLFQYYGADAELILTDQGEAEDEDQDEEVTGGNKITLLLGSVDMTPRTPGQKFPIGIDKQRGLSIQDARGRSLSYGFQDGLGVIFLRPSKQDRLEVVIWGSDPEGLRMATRLVSMLTGVGQPDFMVVGKDCARSGAGAVVADCQHYLSKLRDQSRMSADTSSGSPPSRYRPPPHFLIHEDKDDKQASKQSSKPTHQTGSVSEAMLQLDITDNTGKSKHKLKSSDAVSPLSTSKLANLPTSGPSRVPSHKKTKMEHDSVTNDMQENTVDALLTKLSEQQPGPVKNSSDEPPAANSASLITVNQEAKAESSLGSVINTPATDTSSDGETKAKEDDAVKAEMLKLQKELDAAKKKIDLQAKELDRNRVINHTLDQAFGSSPEDAGIGKGNKGSFPSNTRAKPPVQQPQLPHPSVATSRFGNNHADYDAFSDTSDQLPTHGYYPGIQSNWSNAHPPVNPSPTRQSYQQSMPIWSASGAGPVAGPVAATARPWDSKMIGHGMQAPHMFHPQPVSQQRVFSGPPSPGTIGDGRFVNDYNSHYQTGFGMRRATMQNPRGDTFGPHQRNNANGWPVLGNGIGALEGTNVGINANNNALGIYQHGMPYQPRPIGTPLSPTASEFRTEQAPGNPWNAVQASNSPGPVYVQPMEPLNYRRLLDRSVSCNWKYIVDKIVCNNDQQASIFLQQKLKVGTVEQKYEIIEAIVAQAYPLMVNRFGNFLVQRCFEHGTPEQVVAIANAIRGNTLSLSMDAFGCHVVQKAFDAVPEEFKAIMVHELLRRIPETVIHRYACHVWQKLFELRWADSPPQIMKYVNEALRGMWHDVALGETGSLVVQNIFENCLEEDKRPCINEVLNNIDIVAHGQFGNWCIQHICEHGAPQDRSRAIEHVLRYATEYSMDQFASKVVEKCLKIGGSDFLERYLERVCEGRPDRPRIPLIDKNIWCLFEVQNLDLEWVCCAATRRTPPIQDPASDWRTLATPVLQLKAPDLAEPTARVPHAPSTLRIAQPCRL
ncbi:MAG: hypothetical protein Q9174_001767 [Haloplaca sp. 1 TL-2023]